MQVDLERERAKAAQELEEERERARGRVERLEERLEEKAKVINALRKPGPS